MSASAKLKKIESDLESIRVILNLEPCTIDDKDGKLSKLAALTGLAAECQAQAGGLYKEELAKAIRVFAKEKYTPSVIIKMAEGEVTEFGMCYEYSQRISSAIAHSIDAIRTQISLHKTELVNSQFQKV